MIANVVGVNTELWKWRAGFSCLFSCFFFSDVSSSVIFGCDYDVARPVVLLSLFHFVRFPNVPACVDVLV